MRERAPDGAEGEKIRKKDNIMPHIQKNKIDVSYKFVFYKSKWDPKKEGKNKIARYSTRRQKEKAHCKRE